MKVITVVLAIVACVAAKEMMGFAHIYFNSGQSYSPAGTLIFTQSSSAKTVRISGFVENFKPAVYIVTVHDQIQFTDDCASLGETRESSPGELFHVSIMNITTNERADINGYSLSSTLEPNRPNSINGRAIAFYNLEKLYITGRKIANVSVACGEVLVMQ